MRNGNSRLSCDRAAIGGIYERVLWRLAGEGDTITLRGGVADTAAEGHLLCIEEHGTLSVLEMTPKEYKVKGEVPNLLAYKAWALPALADKKLFLRDEKHLVCVDLSKP